MGRVLRGMIPFGEGTGRRGEGLKQGGLWSGLA